jgi:hypothetical protein
MLILWLDEGLKLLLECLQFLKILVAVQLFEYLFVPLLIVKTLCVPFDRLLSINIMFITFYGIPTTVDVKFAIGFIFVVNKRTVPVLLFRLLKMELFIVILCVLFEFELLPVCLLTHVADHLGIKIILGSQLVKHLIFRLKNRNVDLHTTEYGQLNCLFENAPLSFAGRDFPA